MSEIKKIIKEINVFREERDWKKFHNPKDVALSLVLEATEVMEHFQWKNNHFIKNHNKRGAQIKNIKFYIQQAYELYEAAKYCKPNSAALFYYYSFLNLGKGLCEIKYSNFHLKTESKKHGINWKQKKTSNINLKTEKLILSTRGVWHCMLDYLTESNNTLQNPHEIRVKDLLSYCPEISHEYQQSFGEISKLLTLIEPNIMTDNNNNCWIIFSVSKEELISLGLSKNRFLDLISPSNNHYDEVQPDTEKSLKFQTSHSQTIVQPNDIDFYKVLHNDIISLNPSVHLVEKGVPVYNTNTKQSNF